MSIINALLSTPNLSDTSTQYFIVLPFWRNHAAPWSGRRLSNPWPPAPACATPLTNKLTINNLKNFIRTPNISKINLLFSAMDRDKHRTHNLSPVDLTQDTRSFCL